MTKLEALQRRCYQLKDDPSRAKEYRSCILELAREIRQLNVVYVAFDLDFRDAFPFLYACGCMEMFTSEERVDRWLEAFNKNGLGHVEVRPVEQAHIHFGFCWWYYNGFRYVRLDNGTMPLEMKLEDFFPFYHSDRIMVRNIEMRRILLYGIQLDARLKRSARTEQDRRQLMKLCDDADRAAFKAMHGGLFYTLIWDEDAGEEQVLHTFAAARLQTEEYGYIGERNEGQSHILYQGAIDPFLITRGDGGRWVCAFTSLSDATCSRENFGYSDRLSVLAVTDREICAAAASWSGIVMDVGIFNLRIPRSLLRRITDPEEPDGTNKKEG